MQPEKGPRRSGASGVVKRRTLSPTIFRKIAMVLLFVCFPFKRFSLWHWCVRRLYDTRPFNTLFDETSSLTDKKIREWTRAVHEESSDIGANVAFIAGGVVIACVLFLAGARHIAEPLKEMEHATLTWVPVAKPGLEPAKSGGGGGGGERLPMPVTKGVLPPSCPKEPCAPPSAHRPETNAKVFLAGGLHAPVPPKWAPSSAYGEPEAPTFTPSQGSGGGGSFGTGSGGGFGEGFGTGLGPGFYAGTGGGTGGTGDSSPFRVNWPPGQVCEPPLSYPCPSLGDGLRELINLPKTIARLDVVVKNSDGEIDPKTLKLMGLYAEKERKVGKKVETRFVKLNDPKLEERIAKIYTKYWKQWKFPIVFLEKDGSRTPINGGRFYIDTPPIGKR